MDKRRVLSKLLAVICLITLIMPSASTVKAVTTEIIGATQETAKFGISLLHPNGWGYKIQSRKTYRVYEQKGNEKSYAREIYCLDFSKRFPGEDSNDSNYTSTGDISSIPNSDKLKIIAENMYLASMTQEQKDAILSEMFADLIKRTSSNANPVTLEFIKKTINEDDIFFAQQCAIWKYTNNTVWQGAAIWLTQKENPSDSDWYQESNIGEARYEFMREIYEYLVSSELKSKSNLTNPSLQKDEKTTTEAEDGYIVGPFHVNAGTNPDYKLELLDQTGSTLSNYSIVDKDGRKIANNLESAINQDFYIRLPLRTSVTKIVLKLSYNTVETTTKLWTNGQENSQPLMEVEKKVIPGNDQDEAKVQKPEKYYDLALRKYIVKVGNKDITDRKPGIVYNESEEEINYKHKKDPIILTPGETVIYEITVYNEGNQVGKATRVKDYLPEQLEFVKDSALNRQYKWMVSMDGDYIVSPYTADYELQPFNKETNQISSVTLQVECKVKDNATAGVITNIAEIAEDNIDDIDSEPNSMESQMPNIDKPSYKGKDTNKDELGDSDYYYRGQEDDDDFEKVEIKGESEVDLALRKYITAVNGENKDREPEVDVTPLVNGSSTATYKHSKDPVSVQKGDVVIYSIRIYNEGPIDAYANEVTDYIPEGLGFLVNHKVNYQNAWRVDGAGTPTTVKLNTIEKGTEHLSTSDFVDTTSLDDVDVIKGKATIKTNKLQYTKGSTENVIEAFNPSKNEPSSKTLQVACVVLDDVQSGDVLKNIAAVTDEKDGEGNDAKDRDSQPDEINPDQYPDNNNIQDDDDFEKLILNKYDLALKKFLSSVGGEEINPSRMQTPNTKPLQDGEEDAEYPMDKSVVKVKNGQNVVYTIRVYNEGEVDAYAEEVRDDLPDGLVFLEDSDINKEYRWKVKDGQVVTDYLSKEVNPDKVIHAFDKTTGAIDSQEVKIEFRVDKNEAVVIKNIAEITDDNGDDIDSTPNNDIPEEDDQDYDNIIPSVYDLALQKFITKVNDNDIDTRIPMVSTDENGKIVYNHTNDPLVVTNQSKITYTIRVYNEGTVEAYVEEVKDDIPNGLVYLPDDEINQKYGWKLYDAEGNEVENVEDAKYVRTTYLSQEESEARGENNQLKPYDKALGITNENPDYRDVQVTFLVDQSKLESLDKKIKNIAEITDDNGDDIDSTPDNDTPGEDDIDDEEIELKYFDLSLVKYISKVIINEDGVTKEINTGHNGTENPEPAVKVEINRKKLNKTTVTFIYTIKVTNEGEIEGYAKEIEDRIPEGLEFYQEDNPQWKITSEGKVTTDALANTLLQPGESATVEIALRWKKSENNLGMKINTAEITKDENPYGTPDIDSTPNNNQDGEDDQDTAPVVLSVSTGYESTYIILTISIATILSTGSYMIMKFVL